MLFAAGAIAFENVTRLQFRWSRARYTCLIIVSTCLLAPTVAPILPVETYIRYQKAIGLAPLQAENQPTGPLPQHFADEFGWEDMAREVARQDHELTPQQGAATA